MLNTPTTVTNLSNVTVQIPFKQSRQHFPLCASTEPFIYLIFGVNGEFLSSQSKVSETCQHVAIRANINCFLFIFFLNFHPVLSIPGYVFPSALPSFVISSCVAPSWAPHPFMGPRLTTPSIAGLHKHAVTYHTMTGHYTRMIWRQTARSLDITVAFLGVCPNFLFRNQLSDICRASDKSFQHLLTVLDEQAAHALDTSFCSSLLMC